MFSSKTRIPVLFGITLCLFSALSCTAATTTPKGYKVIEDKTTLPLLNPSLSSRKTIKIQLDNGLQAYLISDSGAEQSAAALSVEAGSWNDPKEYPGMAHFLEHMLFMGTKAYPKEFEYMQYITDHGGMVNASTWPDHTIYMFSINNEAYDSALDRFSHFFIDPLFSPSCISRELHAVDQEHAKNIENDGWREYMVFKETGNPAHPNAAFSTGNAKTLSGIPQEALKKWYAEQYSAQKMHLVMLSPLPLEQMIELTLKDFSPIINNEGTPVMFSASMISPKQMGHIIYIKPIKDLRRLSLVWQVPQEFAKDQDRKALDFVSYILKNNADNSLLEELKREKIAEDLDVSSDRFGKEEIIFRMDILLTEEGVSKIDTAITRCFQAIERLKKTPVSPALYTEMDKLARLNYQYQSKEEAFNFVFETANAMIYENLETFPEKTSLPSSFDPAFISSFINTLTPTTCIYIVQASPSLTGVPVDTKEKWMQAEYAVKDIPRSKLISWAAPELHPQIDLPAANPFVPQHLALVSQSSGELNEKPIPITIANNEGAKVYYAADTKYLVPEAALFFSVKTPLLDGSAKKSVLLDLYLKALDDKTSSLLFFANAAGLHPYFKNDNLKLSIKLTGFSEKAPEFLTQLVPQLKSVTPSKAQFEIYKQSLSSYYDNASKELPFRQGLDLLAGMIYNDTPTNSDKLFAIQSISYEDFQDFSQTLFKKAYVEGLIYGNLTQEEAQSVWGNFKTELAYNPYPVTQQIKKQVLVLPAKNGPFMINVHTQRQGNGVVLLVQEGPFSFEHRAAQQILGKGLQEGFFDTLRTKQQTGYIAKAMEAEVERQLMQFFIVQSSTHNCADLIARFELFLEDFVKNMNERISTERFDTVRSMLIKTIQMPPENLSLMAAKLFTCAFDYQGDFNWDEKRIQALRALSYEKFLKISTQFLSRDNQKRLAILVEGVLSKENDFHYERVSKQDVCDLGTYVSKKNDER